MAPSITGFQVSGASLTYLPTATKSLSSNQAGLNPAQIQFAPGGGTLVVTEKSTNKIDTFVVAGGIAGTANAQDSKGTTPYGFAFSANQQLIVTEAATMMPTKGTVSSYSLAATTGTLTAISNQVGNGQTAPCWVVVSGNNAFVTNTATNNVSAYTVGTDGMLSLLANGNSATTGMGPTDEAITEGKDFLYVLNSKDHSLSTFAVTTAGTLTKKGQDLTGVPANAVGLVAR